MRDSSQPGVFSPAHLLDLAELLVRRSLGHASWAQRLKCGRLANVIGLIGSELTIDTGTLENLAGLTAWSQAIAFDLDIQYNSEISGAERLTFLLRQDLQFMASRGSTVARRGARRSMVTCGRDMTLSYGGGIWRIRVIEG